MKTFTVVSMILAAGVSARNCTPGLFYCANTLKAIGNYGDQIGQALHDSGHGSANHDKVIFYCEGGDDGLIKFAKECPGGCVDNGDGISDVCEVVPRSFRRRNVAM